MAPCARFRWPRGQCELYQFLTDAETNPSFAGEITWNFEKFLISRKGEVAARFAPRTLPDDPSVIEAIDTQLAAEAESSEDTE